MPLPQLPICYYRYYCNHFGPGKLPVAQKLINKLQNLFGSAPSLASPHQKIIMQQNRTKLLHCILLLLLLLLLLAGFHSWLLVFCHVKPQAMLHSLQSLTLTQCYPS